MSGWQKVIFEITVQFRGNEFRRSVGGWVNGPFGLDRRPYYGEDGESNWGWVISHLQTGGIVRGVKGKLADAMAAAEALLSHDVWDFTDMAEAVSRGEIVKQAMAEHPQLCAGTAFDGPPFLEDDL